MSEELRQGTVPSKGERLEVQMQLQRCVWKLNCDFAFLFETRKSPSIEQHQWNKDTRHFCCIQLSIYRPLFRAISGYDRGVFEAFALLPPYTVYVDRS